MHYVNKFDPNKDASNKLLNFLEFSWILLNFLERMKEFSWIYLNLLEFTWIYLNLLAVIAFLVNGLRTDPRTDGPTDGRTDKASYRDAWTHLIRRRKSLGSNWSGRLSLEPWVLKMLRGGKITNRFSLCFFLCMFRPCFFSIMLSWSNGPKFKTFSDLYKLR